MKLNKEKIEAIIVLCAIGVIGILEAIAMLCGMNGHLFMSAMALIGFLAGIPIPKEKIFTLFKKN